MAPSPHLRVPPALSNPLRMRLDLNRRDVRPLCCWNSRATCGQPSRNGHGCPNPTPPGRADQPWPSASRFDRWASSYEDNTLQQYLFVPVHQTSLQLAVQLLPHSAVDFDIGCGTGRTQARLLPNRRARRRRPCRADGHRQRGHPHQVGSRLRPWSRRVPAVHQRGVRPDLHHPVPAALGGPAGRDRRDRPRPHPWRGGGPCRRLPSCRRGPASPCYAAATRSCRPSSPWRSPPITWTSSAVTVPSWFRLPDDQVIAARQQRQPSARLSP